MGFNVAIDGPAGAGKSTIAKRVASELSFIYVDTGAMYRAIGLYTKLAGIDAKDEAAVSEAVKPIDVTIRYQNGEQQVLLNGENVNGVIRGEEVGALASTTSAYPAVRAKLLSLQRQLAEEQDVLMDGRDIGTTVLPNADVKIFLTADPAVRAKRRYDEMIAKGVDADLEKIRQEIIDRDYRDMHREVSPLAKAEDAIEVDTSAMNIDEVTAKIIALIGEKR